MFSRLWFHITHPTKSHTHIYRHLGTDGGACQNPWGFIRVKNEIDTLPSFLASIEGVICRGVIAYNDCTDGSDKVIEDFCQKNTGFIPLPYSKEVLPASSPEYSKEEKYWAGRSLADYYNYAFSHIPDGDWFLKLDADHIFDSEKLKKLISLPEHSYDLVHIDSLNCGYIDNHIYMLKRLPLRIVGDCWLMKKTKDLKFTMIRKMTENNRFCAYEYLRAKSRRHITTDITNWHFPYHKSSRKNSVTQDDFEILEKWCKEYGFGYDYLPREMLDESYIKSFLRNMRCTTYFYN